jgi:glycosyltransferase involved in cell wall biosynthesis
VKVAVVVQRYGAGINGGAELHARYIAEHLARHVQVEVLTTCARDYITWANEYPAGEESVNGVRVRRFPVSHPRDPKTFGDWSARVFSARHSVNDELAWLDAEGPTSPALVKYVADRQAEFDFILFFSFRYYHSYHGARAVPGKAILVPTAERDEALGLGIFPPVFRAIRAFMYNSPEERALLQAAAGGDDVPGVVVGVGSEVPATTAPDRFRQKTGIHERTAIYIGRIDENKGCVELFDFWKRYAEITPGGLTLVLIGTPVLPVPDHPRIRHLGFVSDEEKFDALAAAEFLIMPSYFESLSMVALEAWALGKPVLANGRCDVLRGQAVRSNAGLYYENYAEFVEAVRVLDGSPGVAQTLGRNGRQFFRSHYAWPVIERKYLDMFERLRAEDPAVVARRPLAPLPGWWARRQKTLAPAREVLGGLPSGPVTGRQAHRSQPAPAESRERQAGRDHDGRPVPRDREPRETRAGDDRGRARPEQERPQARDASSTDRQDGNGGRDGRDRGERRDGRQGREGRDGRDGRQARDGREGRRGRGNREGRDGRDAREGREGRDARESREGRDTREAREGHAREGREGRDGREGRERRDGQAPTPESSAANPPAAPPSGDASAQARDGQRHRASRGRHRRGRRHGARPAGKENA